MAWSALLTPVLGQVAGLVAPILKEKIRRRCNPTEVEKALEAGIKSAHQQVENLFLPCELDAVPHFLVNFLKTCAEEFSKPFDNEGTPNIEFLVEAFKKAANQDSKIKDRVNNDLILTWMETFVKAYLDRTIIYIKFQLARDNYLAKLDDRLSKHHFVGIAVAGQEDNKSDRLEKIFVMPDVREEVKNNADLELGLKDEASGNRQAELLQWQRARSRKFLESQSAGQKFAANELLSKRTNQKIVLLGGPGSGKTTLINYFAMMLARKQPRRLGLSDDTDLLPIVIRIRDLAQQGTLDLLGYIQQAAETEWQIADIPQDCFKHWLKEGQALILIDGLDEVPQQAQQVKIVEHIESFLAEFKGNPAIITSRPAGYRAGFFRTEGYPHYEVQPFDDEKIERFIEQWYNSRCPEPTEAQRLKNKLWEALAKNDRIKLLARNPLLLTIIALINRFEAELPKKRYKLYEKAVETLLTVWNNSKSFNAPLPLEYLKTDNFQRLMEQVAYWIHSQGSTGDRESGTLIDRKDLTEQLSQYVRSSKKIELYEARKEATRFLEYIRDRAGLLELQGKNCYAFVHKTFQEYLAAEDIDYRHDNNNDFKEVLKPIQEHLHDPHWREVLLLLVAKQKSKKAAKAIRQILTSNSPYESWLHRDLFFAAQCLAEDPQDLQVAPDDPSLEILEQLIELEMSESSLLSDRIRSQVFQILCSFGDTEFAKPALKLLKAKGDRIKPVLLQQYRAALGEEKEAIEALLKLMRDNTFSSVIAAWVLGNLSNASEAVVAGLFVLLLIASDSRVRFNAALALGKLSNASEAVVAGLLALLAHPESMVRFSAALALGNLSNASEAVVAGLLALFTDPELEVRSRAAEALGKLGNASEAVVAGLLALFTDPELEVRSRAAEALGNLGHASEELVTELLALLADPELEVRSRAAEALGKLGNASDVVVTELLALLADPESRVRFRAAEALGKLGNASEAVVAGLLALFTDPESRVRSSAAEALGKLGNASEAVMAGLLALLTDPESMVSYSAAEALGKLGNASDVVVTELLALLADPESRVRFRAAEALGKLGNASEAVVTELLALFTDPELEVRFRAAEALGQLGNFSNEVASKITNTVAEWIEQHQDSEYAGMGINILWDLVVGKPS